MSLVPVVEFGTLGLAVDDSLTSFSFGQMFGPWQSSIPCVARV